MAKYAENVNQQTKIIDVQKQFPGGLKTVDTDDALGKVYLRKADNVSLSEFSFLEKRHGQYIEHTITFNSGEEPNTTLPIQGYFEYAKSDGNIDKLLFIDGKAYVQIDGSGNFNKILTFSQEEGFNYPSQEIFEQVLNTTTVSNSVEFEADITAGLNIIILSPENFVVDYQDTFNANLNVVIQGYSAAIEENYSDTFNANLATTVSSIISNFSEEYTDTFNATLNTNISST